MNHTTDVCPRIALLENGVIIRDIDNAAHTAEQELESYFNVNFTAEIVSAESLATTHDDIDNNGSPNDGSNSVER